MPRSPFEYFQCINPGVHHDFAKVPLHAAPDGYLHL